ncbi:hypothetical protein V6N12_048708 [Hibiscus sabdariffa]|uniref:Uncharacterized protein n=1 Tax=Hibiscus sabdariffa TaxID=183260 RepID=A0ABR2EI27_9ROSI
MTGNKTVKEVYKIANAAVQFSGLVMPDHESLHAFPWWQIKFTSGVAVVETAGEHVPLCPEAHIHESLADKASSLKGKSVWRDKAKQTHIMTSTPTV